jgi:hypothetical protein
MRRFWVWLSWHNPLVYLRFYAACLQCFFIGHEIRDLKRRRNQYSTDCTRCHAPEILTLANRLEKPRRIIREWFANAKASDADDDIPF